MIGEKKRFSQWINYLYRDYLRIPNYSKVSFQDLVYNQPTMAISSVSKYGLFSIGQAWKIKHVELYVTLNVKLEIYK